MSKSTELIDIINKKKTILVLSLDVNDKKEFFKILKQCAPYICALKLHFELCSFLKGNTLKKLLRYSKKYNFIIIEDRKFADIGNTQKLQALEFIKKGITYFTSHMFTGKKALESFPRAANIFLISDMSCENAFFSDKINLRPIINEKLKEYYKTIPQIVGFVSQNNITIDSNQIILRPGVRISTGKKVQFSDKMGQKYKKPKVEPHVCWVVGREIYQAEYPDKIAKQYKILFQKNKTEWSRRPQISYV